MGCAFTLSKHYQRGSIDLAEKQKATFHPRSGLSENWLHRVDEFRNCFLYENIFETNPQFQAIELAIARM
jgi:hypothetical protein